MAQKDTLKGYSLLYPSKGFTLLELIIVIAILGVLAAIAIPNVYGFREKAVYTRTKEEIRLMEKEIISFYIINGRFPVDLKEVGLGGMTDHWGNSYQYLNIAAASPMDMKKIRKNYGLVPVNSDFDLYSMGPDGTSMGPFTAKVSQDDIVRANNGAFIGRVADY